MVFFQSNGAFGTLIRRHAVVQLRSELVKRDTVSLENHEQMINHVRSFVAQMIDRRLVLLGKIDRELVELAGFIARALVGERRSER